MQQSAREIRNTSNHVFVVSLFIHVYSVLKPQTRCFAQCTRELDGGKIHRGTPCKYIYIYVFIHTCIYELDCWYQSISFLFKKKKNNNNKCSNPPTCMISTLVRGCFLATCSGNTKWQQKDHWEAARKAQKFKSCQHSLAHVYTES